MNMYSFVNEILFAALEGFVILTIFLTLFNKKNFIQQNIVKTFVFVFLYTVFSYWASTYIPVGYHTIIIVTFAVISLSFITSSHLIHSFIVVMISSICFMIIESTVVMMFAIFKDVNFADIINISKIKFEISLLIKGIELFLSFLIYRSKRTYLKDLSINSGNSGITYLLLGIFLMGVFIFSINYIIATKVNIILYEILLFFIFVLFIFCGIFVYKEKEQLLKMKHKVHLQEEYIKNIETVINIIRQEKHDFMNHMNTIHAICSLKKSNAIEQIDKYVNKLTNNLQVSYHYYNTGNDYVDGLLAVKSNFAFQHNISFEVDFENSLYHIDLDEYDLVSIISNLIDNAFEAIIENKRLEDEVVSVCTYIEDSIYYLSVANTGPPISQEMINKVFDKGFSTKQNNKEDHGLGLYIIKEIIQKNKGEIIVLSNENETQFLVKFYLKECSYGKDSSKYHKLNTA
ncbi:sensor histidine kinase [Inediibacterium massiliense]|uniref:sensor histidine kinase n=1 Tax=Inediibacterium massiliense TaxID=1658111 RepID=UPI0006B619AF|nr:ATP-binding protein [Inediibacterium massiliense]